MEYLGNYLTTSKQRKKNNKNFTGMPKMCSLSGGCTEVLHDFTELTTVYLMGNVMAGLMFKCSFEGIKVTFIWLAK